MNHYFYMSFGADEICVIKHFPTGFEFYPQKFREHHFLLETDLKLMAFMRPYTMPVKPTRSTKYERWASRVTGKTTIQESESGPDYESTLDFEDTSPLIIIKKQVERPLIEHTANLDI